jgi:hypothetical protein
VCTASCFPPCSYNLDYYGIEPDAVFLLSVTINFDPFIMQVGRICVAGSQVWALASACKFERESLVQQFAWNSIHG